MSDIAISAPVAAQGEHEEWTAIVLAGERPGGDPLARAMGVAAKPLLQIGGMTMIDRVAQALLRSEGIGRIVVLAQDTARLAPSGATAILSDERISFARSGGGIADSIANIAGSDIAPWPVLVTTADNALLTPKRVAAMLAGTGTADLAIGLGERRIVEERFPETRRTWLKFADGHFSGANLFALRTARCGPALAHWAGVEKDRKKGIKLIASFGPVLLLRVLTRTIGLGHGLTKIGRKWGLAIRPVLLDAEAPIDVDKPGDVELVERILRAREGSMADGT